MKKQLLAIACASMMTTSFAAYALEGSGTEADPFKISTAADLRAMPAQEAGSYFILMNDIDLKAEGNFNEIYASGKGKEIHFDGNAHVIKNPTCNGPAGSLFGYLDGGSIKNLGIEDATVTGSQWGAAGIIACYVGYSGGEMTIDNCYTSGNVTGYFAGGLVGGVNDNGALNISNCYSSAMCTSPNYYAGGLVACANFDTNISISKCYVSGDVTAAQYAGGILGANNQYRVITYSTVETINLTDCIMLGANVTGGIAAGAIMAPEASLAYKPELTIEGCEVWEYTTVNGVECTEDGKNEDDLKAIVCSWDAFIANPDEFDLPLLDWQINGLSGISEITVDNADHAPVYYNLQGVKVANPENGIYVVRRGNKVTKEIVR